MLAVLRKLAIAAIVVVFVLIAVVLAYGNQDPINVDIGIVRFESVSLAVSLAITFSLGAVCGALACALILVRHFRERQTLRRRLRRAEADLLALSSSTHQDAD